MNHPNFSLSFDSVTTTDFLARSVSIILVRLVARGCEGTKVEVLESPSPELVSGLEARAIESLPGTLLYMSETDAVKLQGARVIAAKGKWFLQSPNIQSRCGCGSSFSFEDKVVAFLSAGKDLAELSPLCQASEDSGILQSGTYFITNMSAATEYTVAPGATVSVYELIAATDAEEQLDITVSVSAGATLTRRSLVLGVPERVLSYRATSHSSGDHSNIDHEMLVYGLASSQVRVDAIGQVPSGLSWVTLRVHESQIFLGEGVRFRGIPSLAISSHDVVASHSLTTRGIDPLTIAYTTSRGLSAEIATKMLISSQITALAAGLPPEIVAHIVSYLLAFTHPKHWD
jgi:SUF system FeS cluster assembly, SufBD